MTLECLKFLIFGGRTVDAWPEPTYEEKIRVPPPPPLGFRPSCTRRGFIPGFIRLLDSHRTRSRPRSTIYCNIYSEPVKRLDMTGKLSTGT